MREREGALALGSFESEERRSSHRPKDNKHSGNPAEPGSHEREAMAPSTTLHRGRCHPSQITSTCTCWMPIERGGGAGRGEARQGGKGREAKGTDGIGAGTRRAGLVGGWRREGRGPSCSQESASR